MLGGRIGRHERQRNLVGNGPDHDQRSAALLKMGKNEADGVDCSPQGHGERPVEIVLIRSRKCPVSGRAGIDDSDVEPAESHCSPLDSNLQGSPVGDIRRADQRIAAGGPDLVRGTSQAADVACKQRDAGAAVGKSDRRRQSNPARRTRDEDALAPGGLWIHGGPLPALHAA
jgi:hypothetical protein